MRQKDKIGLIALIACLVFAVVISLYHVRGNDSKLWSLLWVSSENSLMLTMSLYIAYLSDGFLKIFFRWVFPPYFVIKLVYHFCCYVGFYLMSPEMWSVLWSGIAVAGLLAGLVYTLIKFVNGKIDADGD